MLEFNDELNDELNDDLNDEYEADQLLRARASFDDRLDKLDHRLIKHGKQILQKIGFDADGKNRRGIRKIGLIGETRNVGTTTLSTAISASNAEFGFADTLLIQLLSPGNSRAASKQVVSEFGDLCQFDYSSFEQLYVGLVECSKTTLNSKALDKFSRACREFDLVVFDLGTIDGLVECKKLVGWLDLLLLIVEPATTRNDRLGNVIATLNRAGAKHVAMIVNQQRTPSS